MKTWWMPIVAGWLMVGAVVTAADPGDFKERKFELLTESRIAALPAEPQVAWREYIARSQRAYAHEFAVLKEECQQVGRTTSFPAPAARQEFEPRHEANDPWYGTNEAKQLAAVVISYQTPSGGWSKGIDYGAGPRTQGTHWTAQSGTGWHYCGTLDNRSSTEQIRFLAEMFTATHLEAYAASALRGIQYLLAAQFPNGGWPQNYPLEPGYHEAITLNDDAMLHAMEVLLAVAQGEVPFAFVDPPTRQAARSAYDRAIDCLAAAQYRVYGQPTVWGAQHDPLSLDPVAARAKEPPSLSGGESANLLKFLMRVAPVEPRTTAMVEPALRWLDHHRLTGIRKTRNAAGKTDYVADATSTEVYWARFYDPLSGRPMFAGAQDGIVYSTFTEMAARNKVAYDYYTTRPLDLLEKEESRWRKRLQGK